MKIEAFELRRIAMPLRAPFRTSFGSVQARDILLIRALTDGPDGWGECVAEAEPRYSSEYVDGAVALLTRFLLPALLATPDLTAARVAHVLAPFRGHRMAKAVAEAAVLDAELRAAGIPLAQHLGGVRDAVDCGVSVGIEDDLEHLLDVVEGFVEAGYRRIKLKIEPGNDLRPTAAVRERFGDDLVLQVDANAAYGPRDLRHLAQLDAFDLLLIEQPFDEEDLRTHARLAERIATPVCLDESVTSAAVAVEAIAMGACEVVNIKFGRVGGLLEARRVHDVCVASGIPVWCGGMLETGIGRAANVALAALPGFVLPNDTSASERYWAEDLTEPFVMDDGRLRVPTGSGIGVTPDPDRLEALTTAVTGVGR